MAAAEQLWQLLKYLDNVPARTNKEGQLQPRKFEIVDIQNLYCLSNKTATLSKIKTVWHSHTLSLSLSLSLLSYDLYAFDTTLDS